MGHTVDCDGNALGKNIAICALEGWDFPKLVKLQVFRGDTLSWLRQDKLNVELVLLGHSEDGCGAWVALGKA